MWEATAWTHSMDAGYYALFSEDKQLLCERIRTLFLDPAAEFFPSQFLRQGGDVAGFVTFFPGSEVFARRIHVLRALMAVAPDKAAVKQQLQTYPAARGALGADTLYLSKLYVAAHHRGSGVATLLLEHFIDAATAARKPMALHVERNNTAAIALYRKSGFTVSLPEERSDYVLMLRGLTSQDDDAVS